MNVVCTLSGTTSSVTAKHSFALRAAVLVGLVLLSSQFLGDASGQTTAVEPVAKALRPTLLRTVDLNLGESANVTLSDGKTATVKLLDLKETRDSIRDAVRRAEVTVEVNGERQHLISATYHLPTTVAGVRVDCPITKGYYSNTNQDAWGLVKDARLRLWPAGAPMIEPDEFLYPAKQRWFATSTQMANEPTYVDGVERPSARKIYYHSGEDIGGAEGMVEVVAATDGLVVSSGLNVLDGHRRTKEHDSPVAERYDVVYLLDGRGWYYRYSHLQKIDSEILPGRTVRKGDRIGILGKEGASGGWSHLHFEIKSRQPSGNWGTQAAYGMLWEAYQRQYHASLIAVARPHHLLWSGDSVVLDGSRSWSAAGPLARYEWTLTDGSKLTGEFVERTYNKPGEYSEILKVTDAAGNVDYDFAVVQVLDRSRPDQVPQGIHATYSPTMDLTPGDAVTFQVRSFGPFVGNEVWDFGDGTPPVEVRSDGNAKALAKDGYAKTVHKYEKPGHYLVSVRSTNDRGETATARLHVRVGASEATAEHLRLTLPPRCFSIVGQPLNIYFDNLVLTKTPERYRFKFVLEQDGKTTAAGTHGPRHWTFSPDARHIGTHRLRVTVSDQHDRQIDTATSEMITVPAESGTDRDLALLIVGDSLTHATTYPNELAKLLSQPGNPRWTMLGTHRPAGAAPGVAHEGYGGWTWEAFGSRYFEKPDVVKRQRSSPFVFADDANQPRLDPPRYFDEHCGGRRPDVITFLLGINDCFAAPPDDPQKLDERIDAVFKHADKLLAAMREAAPRAELAVCITTPPNVRQEAFAANYQDRYTRWGWKRIQQRLVEREIQHFASREQERIFLVPTELNVDPVDGYPNNNGVHPNAVGYRQIAETIYAWLKWRLAEIKG